MARSKSKTPTPRRRGPPASQSREENIMGEVPLGNRMHAHVSPTRSTPGTSRNHTSRYEEAGPSNASQTAPQSPRRKARRKQRFPKNNVARQIKALQKSTDLLIPRLSFARLVRQISEELKKEGFGRNVSFWQGQAFQALQEATEMYITCFFEECDMLSNYCKRRTVMQRDVHMVQMLRQSHNML